MIFVGISRNDKEFKDFDESDTKSTVFSGNLRNSNFLKRTFNFLQNFDGLFYFPIKIFIWSLAMPRPRGVGRSRRRGPCKPRPAS